MNASPEIIVSSLDLERLEALLANQDHSRPEVAALQDELDRADVVEPARLPPDVVSMNSTVKFAIEESGETFTRTLVYPRDAGAADTVSILAPVGSALLGLKVGATIAWPTPGAKTRHVRIVDVTYQPERSGDHHR
jgi:regulator of nucleoside diphosphate kinase